MIKVYQQFGAVDILAIGIHPDDIELSAGGTVLSHIAQGYKLGICDLTKGELGTRGDGDTRLAESRDAAEIFGVEWRVNLEMRDGFSRIDEEHILRIAEVIRQCKPKIILANATRDRHPDHGRAATMVQEANFFAGLSKITSIGGAAYRADVLYHYIQDEYVDPDFCIDVSEYVDRKFEAILAYKTQFYQSEDKQADATPISSKLFMDFQDARMRHFGRAIGVAHAEGYNTHRKIGVSNIGHLI